MLWGILCQVVARLRRIELGDPTISHCATFGKTYNFLVDTLLEHGLQSP
jgi:hypothetical protein